jgi:catechol 2,3-dioxygenase-like lactoylglutathione lyase family enzyme
MIEASGVHHVGHVVHDIDAAVALYRSMGFTLPAPSFPVLPARDRARIVGAGNTHVVFERGFLELVTVLDGAEPPAGADLVPLQVPADAVERVTAGITETTARIADALTRFAGLHILVLRSPDVDATAARLSAAGIAHGGVLRLRRPGPDGSAEPVAIGLVEIDREASPEGRLAVAEELPESAPGHPNGALGLVGPTLCVPDAELDATTARYERLTGCPAMAAGPMQVIDLDPAAGQRIEVVPLSELDGVLPGEQAAALPAFVAATVRARDLAATRRLLDDAGLPTRATPAGALFVPAAAASGCAVVFTG